MTVSIRDLAPSVYVFGEPGSLFVKIGVTGWPKNRLKKLRADYAMPNGVFHYEHVHSSAMGERLAHRLLRNRFWFDGEWFVCGPDVATAAIRRATRLIERRRRRAPVSRRATARAGR